jgi:hypothetical protein
MNQIGQTRFHQYPNINRNSHSLLINTSNSHQPGLLATPAQNFTYKSNSKPTKSLRNKELNERRAKGLCFWCDEKFVTGHRCKNKKLYSL